MMVQPHAAPFLHQRFYSPPPPRYCITDMTGSVSSGFSLRERKSNAIMPFQATLPYAQLVFDRQQQALVTLMEVHIVGSRQRIRLWDTPPSFDSTTRDQQQQGLEVEDVSSNSSSEEEHVDDDDEDIKDEPSPASRDLVDLYLLSEYHSKGHYHSPDYDADKGKCTDALVAFLAEVKAKVVARRRKLEEENQEEMLPDYDLMSV